MDEETIKRERERMRGVKRERYTERLADSQTDRYRQISRSQSDRQYTISRNNKLFISAIIYD